MNLHLSASLLSLALLTACGAKNDLAEPPVPLGAFVLGHNIVVADKAQKVPISRDASAAEWEARMQEAVAARFGRYEGDRIYNIGISVDGYALAPPGIPVVAAPKSVLVITANIWDDAKEQKLNAEGKQFTVFESLSGETVIGTGLTRSKAQQMAALSFNAAKKVEDWLLEHPQWFGMTADEQQQLLAERQAQISADAVEAKAAAETEAEAATEAEAQDKAQAPSASTKAARAAQNATAAAPASATKTR